MAESRHGGNVRFEPGREDFFDFSANLNPLGIPDGVAEAIEREIASCCFYPDTAATALRESIAAFEQVPTDSIFCGNGASDIIFRLPMCVRPKTGLTLCPTFCDYERALRAFGAEVAFHQLKSENGFACDERLLETVERVRPGMVFLCNPNNPTGVLTETTLLERLFKWCEANACVLAVDECFLDFAEQTNQVTAKRFLNDFENLVVIKAMTKTFALPGLRIGYAMTRNKRLLEQLRMCGPDWPVSNLAQAAGVAALQNANRYLAETVALVETERLRLTERLTELGFHVFESAANFLLIESPYPFNLKEKLDAHKIRIRDFHDGESPGKGHYRIAVLNHLHNTRLMDTIAQIASESEAKS